MAPPLDRSQEPPLIVTTMSHCSGLANVFPVLPICLFGATTGHTQGSILVEIRGSHGIQQSNPDWLLGKANSPPHCALALSPSVSVWGTDSIRNVGRRELRSQWEVGQHSGVFSPCLSITEGADRFLSRSHCMFLNTWPRIPVICSLWQIHPPSSLHCLTSPCQVAHWLQM